MGGYDQISDTMMQKRSIGLQRSHRPRNTINDAKSRKKCPEKSLKLQQLYSVNEVDYNTGLKLRSKWKNKMHLTLKKVLMLKIR